MSFYQTPNYKVSSAGTSAEDTFEPAEEDFSIINPLGTTSGRDPETIDDAYNALQRAAGVFNTLVSCRDYESYIYDMRDDHYVPLVSNVIVSDRTNDLLYSTPVWTIENGVEALRLNQDTNNLKAGQMRVRALKSVLNTTNEVEYRKSFEPAAGATISTILDKVWDADEA